MVNFRPHILKAVILGESYEDPITGEIVPGTETTIEFPCRVSPNSGGKEVRDQDGNRVVYSYLIHADSNAPALPYGTEVTVYDGEEIKAQGKTLGPFSNTLNTRIWI